MVLKTSIGTQGFLAPEVVFLKKGADQSKAYTRAVDIWSLGEIAHRLLTGTTPFGLLELYSYYTDQSEFPEEALQSRNITGDGRDFVQDLMAADSGARPTAATAFQHRWIRSCPLANDDSMQEISSPFKNMGEEDLPVFADVIIEIQELATSELEALRQEHRNRSKRGRTKFPNSQEYRNALIRLEYPFQEEVMYKYQEQPPRKIVC